MNMQAIVLAAGQSTRFNTQENKLTFTLCGREMIAYIGRTLQNMEVPTTFIVGNQKERIQEIISNHHISATYIEQSEQKGTGHALMCSRTTWQADHILVLNGDVPLITHDILDDLMAQHNKTGAAISFVTAHQNDPCSQGYGRVVENNDHIEIIEACNFQSETYEESKINAGIYLIKKSFLEDAIQHLQADTTTHEIFITDLVAYASNSKQTVTTTVAPFDYIRGINTLKELWTAEHIKRSELISYWMHQGVRFSAAQNVYLDIDVTIGAGSFIGTSVLLTKGTQIGKNCFIDAFSKIENTTIGDGVTVHPNCILDTVQAKNNVTVGPFAHVRNNSVIEDNAVIGNFVEISASRIGQYTKAKHLTYIGNTETGVSVNFGAGTIICNYDGFEKHNTSIMDNALIGSNTSLIAPVTIGKNSMVGAGSTITHNVPAEALAIARSKQTNKHDYANMIRNKKKGITDVQFRSARKTTEPHG